MTDLASKNYGIIVRAFLLAPHNRRSFDDFYRLCYRHALAYLRYLRTKEFALPTDSYASENPLADLAIDILGTFLQSKKGAPFFILFDYFRRHGFDDFNKAEAVELYSHFTILLRGYVRKELTRLHPSSNPQIENLKRRFKDILNGQEYTSEKGKNPVGGIIYKKKYSDPLNLELPMIPRERLLDFVESAYTQSASRIEWCTRIFDLLSEQQEYQNAVGKPELLSAVVAVNCRYIDSDGLSPTRPLGPYEALVRKATTEAITETLPWVRANVTDRFVSGGRITPDEARLFLIAAERYLRDIGEMGETDSIPAYYYEVMPNETSQSYLKKHKHPFETIISKSIGELRLRLRNNPTIRHPGDYILDE